MNALYYIFPIFDSQWHMKNSFNEVINQRIKGFTWLTILQATYKICICTCTWSSTFFERVFPVRFHVITSIVWPLFSSLFLFYFNKDFISKFSLAASISATHSQKVQVHPQHVYVMKISVNVLIIKSHTVVPPPHSCCFICLFLFTCLSFLLWIRWHQVKNSESLKRMMKKRQSKHEKIHSGSFFYYDVNSVDAVHCF